MRLVTGAHVAFVKREILTLKLGRYLAADCTTWKIINELLIERIAKFYLKIRGFNFDIFWDF
jgi:hypothetical protein